MTTHVSGLTCISVSAGVPATNDATGYAALTYTAVGEINSIGDLVTKHATTTFVNFCTNKSSVVKGVEEVIMFQMVVGNDRDDAGQTLMTTARQNLTGKYAFKMVESNGDIQYFRGFVLQEGTQFKSVNDVVMTPYEIGLVTAATGQTIIVVNTP